MRLFNLLLVMSLLACTAQAREVADKGEIAGYDHMIRSAWPHVSLRDEQRQWLATRSAVAFRQCRVGGREERYCRQLVREGLRETIGSEPLAAGLATRSW